MKKEAIEKATSDFDPLFSNEYDIDWEDDEDLLKKLYGLKYLLSRLFTLVSFKIRHFRCFIGINRKSG